ncbi:MAG: TRAP transporter substrate-binding protein [Rhodospirillaceae bacterium]|nr:TRAP transporter substrate-binding protein [Rhodospirillaceae bacterium]
MGATLAGCDQQLGIHWDLSQPWGPREFHVLNSRRFAQEVSQATGGALTIHVHAGAVLGIKGPDTMRAVEEGIVDMAEASSFQQVGTEPILGLESLPYLVESMDELKLLYSFLRPLVEAAYQRHGMEVVYIVPWPNQCFYLDKEIKAVEDLRGLKMRSYDKLSTDLARGLDMTPVQMPTTDVMAALAAGTLDAVMTSTTTAAAQKYWDFLKYTLRTNHTWSSCIMAVNRRSLEALPATHRDTVMNLARTLEPRFWEVSAADDQDKLKVLEANGMITVEPSAELLAAMRAAAKPIVEAFIRQVPGSGAIIERFLAAVGRGGSLA